MNINDDDNLTSAGAPDLRICPWLISASTYYTTLRAVRDALFYVALTFGIPGNILSAIVWLRRRKNSSAVYLAALAINDLLYFITHTYCSGWFTCKSVWFLAVSTETLEPLLVLGFSVERYIAVLRPLQAKVLCTSRRATLVVVTMSLGVCTVSIFKGVLKYFNDNSEFYTGSVIHIINWVVVPVSVLIINVLVVREKRQASHNAAVNLGLQQHHQSTLSAVPTVMLLATSLDYLLLTAPGTVLYLFLAWLPRSARCSEAWGRIPHIAYASFIVTRGLYYQIYAYNFFVYVITGKQFRSELRRLFRPSSSSCTSSSAAAAAELAAEMQHHTLAR